MKRIISVLTLVFLIQLSFGQRAGYWQQKVDYQMHIEMLESAYKYKGKMKLNYTNNATESLNKVYFHLYYNAFQPGSMMDDSLQHISDPDERIVNNLGTKEKPQYQSKIAQLKPNEIGYQRIKKLTQSGKELDFKISGTILEVILDKPITSNTTAVFELEWEAQIPVLIRRTGRDSEEAVKFSMAQWYPKMAEYDEEGWHLDEYVGREFYAPFGDFDVKINIDKDYIIGSSGVLQNPNEVKGYVANAKPKAVKGKLTWHFKAENIHDFVWAADKDFVVETAQVANGPKLFFVYKSQDKAAKHWQEAKEYTLKYFQFMSEKFGQYPWSTYAIIQGGDGGMEYGTATLINGGRDLESLVGVIYHEVGHSWFQQLFGINETLYGWMDEGFTSYAQQLANNMFVTKTNPMNPNLEAYDGYLYLTQSGREEPMSLLADYYEYNEAYSLAAYYKGQVFLIQLEYIIGKDNLDKTFLAFYDKWKFKHPTPNDFKRVAEEVSGINLKWYFNLFVNTVRTIDYAIGTVSDTEIELLNKSNLAMPIDLYVEYEDKTRELFYIPLRDMRAQKPAESFEQMGEIKRTTLEDWTWTNPSYKLKITKKPVRIIIDPTQRLADIDYENNIYIQP